MNCRLIFYYARKTSFCEKALLKCYSELDLSLTETSFAVDNMELGTVLTNTFKNHNIAFIVGGLEFNDDKGIVSIISKAVADVEIDECKKLKNDNGDDGYVIRAGSQILVILPDEPSQIESIMHGYLGKYLQKQLKL